MNLEGRRVLVTGSSRGIVITSYSIHYTKLYEGVDRKSATERMDPTDRVGAQGLDLAQEPAQECTQCA